jgi:hypothetical protein
MNISHVWAARYQHVEVNNTCRPVRRPTLVCYDVSILLIGFQQFTCKKFISDTCWQTGNHPSVFCVSNQDIRRAIITTAMGTKY